MSTFRQLLNEQEFEQLIHLEQEHIFVFYTTWCPDCHYIEPFMPNIQERFKQLEFVWIDRDRFIDLATRYEVTGIPSFLSFKLGKELKRFVSKERKTETEIIAFLEK